MSTALQIARRIKTKKSQNKWWKDKSFIVFNFSVGKVNKLYRIRFACVWSAAVASSNVRNGPNHWRSCYQRQQCRRQSIGKQFLCEFNLLVFGWRKSDLSHRVFCIDVVDFGLPLGIFSALFWVIGHQLIRIAFRSHARWLKISESAISSWMMAQRDDSCKCTCKYGSVKTNYSLNCRLFNTISSASCIANIEWIINCVTRSPEGVNSEVSIVKTSADRKMFSAIIVAMCTHRSSHAFDPRIASAECNSTL